MYTYIVFIDVLEYVGICCVPDLKYYTDIQRISLSL